MHTQVCLCCLRADSTTCQCFLNEFRINFDKKTKVLLNIFTKSKKSKQLQFTLMKEQKLQNVEVILITINKRAMQKDMQKNITVLKAIIFTDNETTGNNWVKNLVFLFVLQGILQTFNDIMQSQVLEQDHRNYTYVGCIFTQHFKYCHINIHQALKDTLVLTATG